MSDRTTCGRVAVNEGDHPRSGVGKGNQPVLPEHIRVNEGVRGPRVDKSAESNGRTTGDHQVHEKRKVGRGRKGEGGRRGKNATQPGPY